MDEIREAGAADLEAVLEVERSAFGRDDEADLVRALTADPTARPLLSLLATRDGRAVGHVLFSNVSLEGGPPGASAALLAPLAVVPEAQGHGLGGRLIGEGMRRLAAAGVDLVFVLGYPEYYRRHGFEPAGRLGLEAPYPVPEVHADAWMVRGPGGEPVPGIRARVRCADALDRREYWTE